ncbi:LamG domain-containing protein [Candidatus Woesearchaeota archaeon]|nr:LamG domain-containing protein [Candidatus Woesearchaeota archaeon]
MKRGPLVLIFVVSAFLASATLFQTLTSTNFNGGTYTNTGYNGSAVMLNASKIAGNYTSTIYDTAAISSWSSIAWTPELCYQCDLPDNKTNETGFVNTTDMNNNVLLLHLDKNGTYENNTYFYDFSGNNLNGTCSGGACPTVNTSARFGSSFYFNGSDNITLGDVLETTINGTYTVAVWIFPIENVSETILSKYSATAGDVKTQFIFAYRVGGLFRQLLYSNLAGTTFRDYNTDRKYLPNSWYHVVFVGDMVGDTYHTYINGTEVPGTKTGNAITNIPSSTEDTRVGNARGQGFDFGFDGNIDELAIWNRTLSPEEIQILYKRGAARLNLSVRSCDDALCSGESFTDIADEPSTQSLSLSSSEYIQYRYEFLSDWSNVTPKLFNVSITYTELGAVPEIPWYGYLFILICVASGFMLLQQRKEN